MHSRTFTMSSTGMPSVIVDDEFDARFDGFDDRGRRAGGRNVDHARRRPIAAFASPTFSKTGSPRCVVPPFSA
jgi:hypothetical protein